MRLVLVLVVAFAQIVSVSPASAAWAPGGNAVCAAANDQSSPILVEDGSGGVFVVWSDARPGTFQNDIYLQRLSGAGVAQFVADGVPVCAAANMQLNARMVRDGFGGVILAWEDRRDALGPGDEIYVQRMGEDGTAMWAPNGVGLPLVSGSQVKPAIIADGQGGAIVAWEDGRLGECRLKDIYARRVDSRGTPQWTSTGVAVCTAPDDQDGVRMASDGLGGAIIGWSDKRTEVRDAYAQRIDGNGAIQWAANGTVISNAPDRQTELALAMAPGGGVLAAWNDWRSGSWAIYAQTLDASGSPQWAANGIAAGTPNSGSPPAVIADASGYLVAACHDLDLYVQRLDFAGVPQWGANGVALCTASGTQRSPQLVSDGAGGAIVTWVDFRAGNGDVYAQRVGPSGASVWPADGVALCTAVGDQERPFISSDGSSGAIVAWEDPRNGGLDLYAQRISASGQVGATTAVEAGPALSFALAPARPNPSTGTVELSLSLSKPDQARVELFDASGRSVRILSIGSLPAGATSLVWDGRDGGGRPVSSGVYYARATVGPRSMVVRIERLR